MSRYGKLVLPLLLFLFAVSSSAQEPELARGLRARDSGDLQQALTHLQRAVSANPQNRDARLALAETLAWMKRFDEAETIYRELLREDSQSPEARLGLARVLLWQLRLDEAETIFRDLLSETPRNADALSGAATVSWWSGEWRAARRYALQAIEVDPQNEAVRRILAELDAASAPTVRIGTVFIDDDQPFRFLTSSASYTRFSDPLTNWTIEAGAHVLDQPLRSETAPFVETRGESQLLRTRLLLNGSVRLLEFPDGEQDVLGSFGASWKARQTTLSASYEKAELLRTSTAIDDHPSARIVELRISRLAGERWRGSASARNIEYFDGNSGVGADAWLLTPRWKSGRFAMAIGPAISYQDTDESRFLPGVPKGVYDPYWTPEDLFEVRGVVDAVATWQKVILRFHADGGWGEETVTPEAVTRQYHPWRATLQADVPLSLRWSLTASTGHERTAFYEASQVTASVAGQF